MPGCISKKQVYTDEQWEQFFIPAINKMIKYNDEFVRWMPGYVIKEKGSNKRYIVFYDYALAYSHLCGRECRDFTSLCIGRLDDTGEIDMSWSWAGYNNYELIDKDHANSNIEVIRRYLRDKKFPSNLSVDLIRLLYVTNPQEETIVNREKEVSITINGETHVLVHNPERESCKLCSLDKLCDQFKDAICNVLAGNSDSHIFKKIN